jgi:hypothetical protein
MHKLSTIYVEHLEGNMWVSCGSTVDSLWVSHIVDFLACFMSKIYCANLLILPNWLILRKIVCTH